mgnify:CR=1 FL=1
MLIVALDTSKKEPLYEQIYNSIKEEIITGVLPFGARLPSARRLSKHLDVSRNTVDTAYAQLCAEGYIESKPKRGFFVCQVEELAELHIPVKIEEEEEEIRPEKIPYDFSSAGVDMEQFPYHIWRKLLKEIMINDNSELFQKGNFQGDLELRKAIMYYLRQSRGVHVHASQIVVAAGMENLLFLLRQILGEKVSIGIENPVYKNAYEILKELDFKIHPISMDESGMCVEQLQKTDANLAYVTPAHQYPTGVIMPIGRRSQLLGWAKKDPDHYIIEDDYDSELRLGGKPIPTLQSIDVSDKVIYMNTFTKTLSSTVRISYMVLPASLTELFYKKLSFYSCTVSNFEQYTLARFMESGSFEKHINRLRNYYQNKRDAILEIFKTAPLDQYITIKEEDSGVHFMMKLKTDRTEMDMISDAKSKGIKLAPLSKYFVDQTSNMNFQNVYVMNYSSIDLEQLPLIFDALCQVLIK